MRFLLLLVILCPLAVSSDRETRVESLFIADLSTFAKAFSSDNGMVAEDAYAAFDKKWSHIRRKESEPAYDCKLRFKIEKVFSGGVLSAKYLGSDILGESVLGLDGRDIGGELGNGTQITPEQKAVLLSLKAEDIVIVTVVSMCLDAKKVEEDSAYMRIAGKARDWRGKLNAVFKYSHIQKE